MEMAVIHTIIILRNACSIQTSSIQQCDNNDLGTHGLLVLNVHTPRKPCGRLYELGLHPIPTTGLIQLCPWEMRKVFDFKHFGTVDLARKILPIFQIQM